MGDKNALIIASRIYGYGVDYNVNLTCEHCGTEFKTTVDLRDFKPKQVSMSDKVERTEENTFLVTPSKKSICCRISIVNFKT